MTWKSWLVVALVLALIFAPVALAGFIGTMFHSIAVFWHSMHVK
jgi:Sec-independent protein translocase protein TatA